MNKIFFAQNVDNSLQLVYDYCGNAYQPIRIGSQVWLDRNFSCNHFADGTTIATAGTLPDLYDKAIAGTPGVFTITSYVNAEPVNDGVHYINSNAVRNVYYNQLAVSNVHTPHITGYHVPSFNDLETLATNAGGASVAGTFLKSGGSGFNFHPSGYTGINVMPYDEWSADPRMYFWLMYTETISGLLCYRRCELFESSAGLYYQSFGYYVSTVIRLIKD